MELPGWLELRAAALPALLGAAMALGALGILRLLGRLRRGARGRGALEAEARRMERGLGDLAAEVEARLDAKLDRLESLLEEARSLVGNGRGGLAPPHRQRLDVASVSLADRKRVLELAALGELPEAIAESVGLLRGEVDLILRLHRTAGPLEEQ